ncbi:MAG TPA: hypothetical protein ENN90_02645 [Mariniphaga anaerophila]|uniref:Uncharacterized protein n=1 Tax=Mariniphaga anaerophila TaxID=1484053 RepID=A0A831LN95_9BACT|nr:hypothetical protein [Mariniphaga anaerophila]
MKITRDNYEVYFLDYLEGELDENLVDDFIDFLRQNPDLKAELEMAGAVKVELENVSFANKEKLYKDKFDLEKEFNYAAVALLEGDLQEKEKAEFENYLSTHPEKQKEAALFEKTRLKADESVVFQKKRKLYRYSTGKTILLWSTRIAAVLVLAFMVYRAADNILTENGLPENQVAVTEMITNTEPAKAPLTPIEPEDDPVPVDKNDDKPAKKVNPKAEPAKSLRETTKGRMDHERIAEMRIPVEIPEKLPRCNASFAVQQPEMAMAPMKITLPETPAELYEERLLADVVREKTGIGNLSLAKVAKAGLGLVSTVSGEKFSFETNNNGEITELNYDSRLLAFTIPTKND